MTAVSPQAPARADLEAKLARCQVPGIEGSALCGRFDVSEAPGSGSGRTIGLNVVLLPATTDSVHPDALVFLAGGGVVPATRFAGFITRAFPILRRGRDVLLVDQRGTWGSHPLACEPPGPRAAAEPLGAQRLLLAALICRDSLARRADLRAYTTQAAVEDLEAVRTWLGYQSLSLYGVSYGTKVAQVYMRRYADRVRAAVLYGVVPVSVPTQLDLARSAQESLALVFQRCASDEVCRAVFPNLAAEFDSLLVRLTAKPVSVAMERPDGSSLSVFITDRAVRDLVQAMLGSARAVERLPLLIHAAHGGDLAPMARALIGDGPPPLSGPPRGVFLSLICSESIPQVQADQVEAPTRGTFFGAEPVRSQLELCARWPRATLDPDFWQPVQASVPVLALSGDLDPITPPRYGELVVAGFANGRHLTLPNRSHNDVDPCITSLFERFLIAGNGTALDTSCVSTAAPLRFATSVRPPPRP